MASEKKQLCEETKYERSFAKMFRVCLAVNPQRLILLRLVMNRAMKATIGFKEKEKRLIDY